jgi:hypothetical protein
MNGIRVSVAAIALVVAMLASGMSAWAGPQWCEEDPEFLVNGALVDVTTFFPGYYASTISGSVHFDLQVPSNVVAAVVSLPGTVPVTASISRTLPAYYGLLGLPVVLTVSMTSSQSFSTYTQVTGLGGTLVNGVYGSSWSPTRAKFSMYGL